MPYAPTTENRSGEILGASMQQGLAGLLQGAQKGNELRQQRKRTETILSALYPDEKDSFAGLSLGELEGLMDKVAVDRAQRVEEREVERLAMDKAEGERRAQQQAAQLAIQERQIGLQERTAGQEQARLATEAGARRSAGEEPTMARDFERMAARGPLLPSARAPQMGTSRAQRYLEAGGMDERMLSELAEMDASGRMPGYQLGQAIPVPGGGDVIVTARGSGQYRPAINPAEVAATARQTPRVVKIGPKTYTMLGSYLFDEQGMPVNPRGATGGDALGAALAGFGGKPGDAAAPGAPAPAAGSAGEADTGEVNEAALAELVRRMEGARAGGAAETGEQAGVRRAATAMQGGAAVVPEGMVAMVAPDGRPGYVRADQVAAAEKRGMRRAKPQK